jgi:signal transduction histidine kinase
VLTGRFALCYDGESEDGPVRFSMKGDISVPYEKLEFFQRQLQLEKDEQMKLERYSPRFVEKKEQFGDFFYDYFTEIPETRTILEHERMPGHLRTVWAHWFGTLFGKRFDRQLLAYLWRSGLRHVEVNTDQRFVNLGYSMARRFCHQVAEKAVPVTDREGVLTAVDKLIDLCLLIETQAFITATSQCDIEVVKGISHQVRNPITIIGGNILRLQKKSDPQSPTYKTCEIMMDENRRLERMVLDIGVYSEMFQERTVFSKLSLESLIHNCLTILDKSQSMNHIEMDFQIHPESVEVQGDSRDLETMFYYLLQNSLEAVNPENPYIRITSEIKDPASRFVEVEIFNTGTPPNPEELDNLFVPFYSSKPYGTGFGLTIAQLAARKNFGEIYLEPITDEGTRVMVRLPIPSKIQ